jgi:hypothetical protein
MLGQLIYSTSGHQAPLVVVMHGCEDAVAELLTPLSHGTSQHADTLTTSLSNRRANGVESYSVYAGVLIRYELDALKGHPYLSFTVEVCYRLWVCENDSLRPQGTRSTEDRSILICPSFLDVGRLIFCFAQPFALS